MKSKMALALLLGSAMTIESALLLAQTEAPAKKTGTTAATSTAKAPATAKPAGARAANSASPAKGAPGITKEQATEFLRHMFGYDPTLQYKVVEVRPSEIPGVSEVLATINNQGARLYVMPDGKHAMTGDVMAYGADPFADARTSLAASTRGAPWKGNPNGKVEIVEFSDLQCPHCKAGQPILEKLMEEQKEVKLVFQQFPIESLHKWALEAASYADCIGRKNNDQFWSFVSQTFNTQDQITEQNVTEKLNENAKSVGADPAQVQACAALPETQARVRAQADRGAALGVTGTPTIFINGRKIVNVAGTPPEVLKAMVEFAAKEAGH
jgi:protein-disulfide isomerase